MMKQVNCARTRLLVHAAMVDVVPMTLHLLLLDKALAPASDTPTSRFHKLGHGYLLKNGLNALYLTRYAAVRRDTASRSVLVP